MPVQKITREEILEKAIDVFGRQGYHRTSMHDLAVACGLFKGSFYHYFGSKEELMREVLDYSLAYFRAHVFSIAYYANLAARERLQQMLDKSLKVITYHNRGCLFGNMVLETANGTAEFRTPLRAFFSEWTQALEQIFRSQYDSQAASELAQQTVMEMEGAIMMMKLHADPEILIQYQRRLLSRLDEHVIPPDNTFPGARRYPN